MDFKDQIKLLGDRFLKLKDQVNTEEATKNAFIMPFIQLLGYDVFNPNEVTPELTADIGMKQGEKIDYAIMKNGDPIILIECKWHGAPLNVHNASQLFRYFHTTKARFSILTNGLEYRFYTDLVEPNKMDEKPFFVFNITDIKDNQIEELKKFHKAYYDFNNIVTTASDLKYTNELRVLLTSEFNNPSPDFVKHFTRQVYGGIITSKVLDQFTSLTKKSIQQNISDLITERLKTALTKEDEATKQQEAIQAASDLIKANESRIVTTDEEREAFMIVKTILRQKIKASRVTHRDAQSYFAILLDDNNRKTICRIYLGAKKCIGLMDDTKKEVKHELSTVDDIFKYSDNLIKTVLSYDKSKEPV